METRLERTERNRNGSSGGSEMQKVSTGRSGRRAGYYTRMEEKTQTVVLPWGTWPELQKIGVSFFNDTHRRINYMEATMLFAIEKGCFDEAEKIEKRIHSLIQNITT
jgi:hypothetical protein